MLSVCPCAAARRRAFGRSGASWWRARSRSTRHSTAPRIRSRFARGRRAGALLGTRPCRCGPGRPCRRGQPVRRAPALPRPVAVAAAMRTCASGGRARRRRGAAHHARHERAPRSALRAARGGRRGRGGRAVRRRAAPGDRRAGATLLVSAQGPVDLSRSAQVCAAGRVLAPRVAGLAPGAAGAVGYRPSTRPRISRMISSLPPPIGPRRASRAARSTQYSRM